ncbi:7533_t:CDS:1, partial [Dentiscutata heterogama]
MSGFEREGRNSEKKVRYLQSDATPLSDDNIQDIINAKNSMKRASEAMASKYKISTRRVYQIWRGNHPLIDFREEALRSATSVASLSKDFNHDANKFDSVFTILENKIHNTKITKSTDLASEENVVSDSKVKRTGGRKSKTKTVYVSDSISSIKSSEDVLDLYKRTSSEIEKIRASGHAL